MRSRTSLPTGTASFPVTAAGVSSASDSALRFGTTFTHSLASASIPSISSSGRGRRSLIVKAWFGKVLLEQESTAVRRID